MIRAHILETNKNNPEFSIIVLNDLGFVVDIIPKIMNLSFQNILGVYGLTKGENSLHLWKISDSNSAYSATLVEACALGVLSNYFFSIYIGIFSINISSQICLKV